MNSTKIVVIAHDIRSTHNIGALLRTADGLAVEKLYFTGYTPHPVAENDTRLPHISKKLSVQIHKTALGAENTVSWEYANDPKIVINQLKQEGYQIIALEQSVNSVMIDKLLCPDKVALLIGREVEGVDPELLKLADNAIEIPMLGKKESFNVVVAAAICIYQIRYHC